MIKIYVDGKELDLFEDEGFQLNRTVKNLTDISKVFASFSQQFTVPASRRNNQILQHYYRDDLQTSISSLRRIDAYITLNGEVFETGGVQIEGASIVNGVPRDYKLGFYGQVSRIREIVGDGTLKDLDLSTYDHTYEAATIIDGFGSETTGSFTGLSSGAVIYPLFSPVRNWVYDSTTSSTTNNIAWVDDGTVNGVYYYELKPALQVTKILDAIEARYGVTFSGSFLTSAPFNQLYMWLHNREGYTFEGVDDVLNQATIVEPVFNVTHSTKPTELRTINNRLQFFQEQFLGAKFIRFDINITAKNEDFFLYYYENGQLSATRKITSTGIQSFTNFINGFDVNKTHEFRIGRTTPNLTVTLEYNFYSSFSSTGLPSAPSTGSGSAPSTSYAEQVLMSNLIPDQPITEFLNGLIKMYNLIVTSDDGVTFNLEPYSDFYGSGNEVDLSRWLDTSEVEVKEIPKYSSLNFKFNESDQFLQKRYRQTNGRGYGDLVERFNFDTDQSFDVEAPFDLPFTELLTDEGTGTSFTDFTVYKSIEVDENGEGSSYYGAPVLFYYGDNLDITSTSISFVDESDNETEIVEIPLCETVNATTTAGRGLTFSEEVNPYLEAIADNNLYDYWRDFIQNTYNQQAKMYSLSAYINMGLYSRMTLKDTVLWKGRRYIINSMQTNFKTSKTQLELVTKL